MTTPGDLLSEAQALADSAQTDRTRRRTVVGRAYYAAYHHLLEHGRSRGYAPSGRDHKGKPVGVHAALIDWLKHQPDRALYDAGLDLEALKNLRIKADYVLSAELAVTQVADALRWAEGLLKKV